MAKYYKILLLFASYIFLLTSCQEGKDAGDLLGQWRLDNYDSKYISFSGSVSLIKDMNTGAVYGNFQHVGDSLFIQCYSEKEQKSDTITVEESFGFKPFNNIRLKIVTLDNDHLVLSKESQTWTLDKY
jgi:hypothetical protein